jgi:uncharacterized cupredoxin-like copper-binding protein
VNRQGVRRFGVTAATAAFALVVLAACAPGGEEHSPLEEVTRVPEMSEAAAEATRVAEVGGTPVLAAGEAAATPAAEGEAPAAAQTVEVVSVDIAFQPTALTIPADTDVTFSLPNQGAAPHNFSIDELSIDVDIAPGATEEAVINAAAGTYEYYCNVPGHREAGMVGNLTVSAEAAPAPAAEDTAAATPAEAGASPVATPAAAVDAATPAPAAAASAEPVEVVSVDIAFQPPAITIPANTDVTFVLPNEGVAPHNFSVDELGIDVDQAPGATEEIVINAPPGTYEYYCNVPGHREAGMVGTLTVSGDAPPAAGAPEAAPTEATPATADAAAATTPAAAEQAAPESAAAAEPVEIVSIDIAFDPAAATIPADTDVPFTLPNEGAAPHNFSIDELGIDVDQAPGAVEETTINAPAGTYEYYCNVPGHREAGMVGILTVE